ncbi:MAG: NAD-dependent epimerase/dehydratase family protein [Lachnospiraceae bacterium]|nr:NAD-dependent epimerase/dehydratase family protein [Lachnospiraceae bacterium]
MDFYQNDIYSDDLKTALHNSIGLEHLKNQSVLLTGATGLIGSFIVEMLLKYNEMEDSNITIYAVSRNMNRLKERFDCCKTQNLIYIEQDMNVEFYFDFSVDYIIHAASNAYPAAFANDPVGTILSNIMGGYYLLGYGKSKSVKRILYISSGEVYGLGDKNIEAYSEDYSGYVDPVQVRSCYPTAKRTTENLFISYGVQYNLDTVIVRPCHTYGANVTKQDNRANAQFITNAVRGEDIVLKSAGLQYRSYCYIADCASAIMTVLLQGEKWEAYNIANENSRATIADFAKKAASMTGKNVVFDIPDEPDKKQQTFIDRQVLDNNKLKQLGWNGRYNLEDGISHTIDILADS